MPAESLEMIKEALRAIGFEGKFQEKGPACWIFLQPNLSDMRANCENGKLVRTNLADDWAESIYERLEMKSYERNSVLQRVKSSNSHCGRNWKGMQPYTVVQESGIKN